MRTWAAGGNSPISSRKSVPPSARSNQPRRRLDRAGERAALVAEQLRVDQFRRNRPAVDAIERAVAARRAIVDRPGDQLLAGARLAEDQHGGVAAGDQFDAVHDRAEPRFDADDRVAERLASQPSQQRAFVGLGGLAQGGHFAQAKVVVQGHRERLQEELGQLEMLGVEGAVLQAEQDQHAAVARRIAQRTGHDVAVVLARGEQGELGEGRLLRRGAARPLRDDTTPAATCSSAGEQSVRGFRAMAAPVRESGGHGLQARPNAVDPADQHLLDRDVPDQHGGDVGGRLADLDVPAGLLPDVQKYLLELFHCSGSDTPNVGSVMPSAYTRPCLSYITAICLWYLTGMRQLAFSPYFPSFGKIPPISPFRDAARELRR